MGLADSTKQLQCDSEPGLMGSSRGKSGEAGRAASASEVTRLELMEKLHLTTAHLSPLLFRCAEEASLLRTVRCSLCYPVSLSTALGLGESLSGA